MAKINSSTQVCECNTQFLLLYIYGPELMKLFFCRFYVSRTIKLKQCYKKWVFYIYICSFSTKLCYLCSRIRLSLLTSAKRFDRTVCVSAHCRISNLTQTTLPQRSSHINL